MGTSGFSRLVLTRLVSPRLAVIGVLAGALALGACGRKGPLEAPPSSNSLATPEQQQGQGPSLGQSEAPGFEDPRRQEMPAPQASRNSFFLDPLINDSAAPPRRNP